jgi:hypothetical protein
MKWNVLPAFSWLSTQMLPPINSTSRREIDSPNPVPPYLRVIEVSACENSWKMRPTLPGAMPIPVSATLK